MNTRHSVSQMIAYILTIVLFVSALTFVLYKYADESRKEKLVEYKLKERKGSLAKHPEWEMIRKKTAYLTASIKKNPKDIKSKVDLASLFIREARITGDYIYYDKAAMRYVEDVLKEDPSHFDALTLKALIQLSQHHFSEGLEIAEKAQRINPYNAFVYGIMVDANIEMGNYEIAVEHSDKMVSLRPDLRSYSRISYLREIHGDYTGAIEAMKLAIEAGAPGDESTEWCRSQLGNLYEKTGNYAAAEFQYKISAEERPGYPNAMAGLSRIALQQKDFKKAFAYIEAAESATNSNSYRDQKIELYFLTGQEEKARKLATELIHEMKKVSEQAEKNPSVGHYTDLELAMGYLKVDDKKNALKHALLEFNRRPMNIDVNETVAWVYYNMGEYEKSIPYIKAALKTNSKNPVLLCRAALIYAQTGNKDAAMRMIRDVFSKKPVMPFELERAGRNALASL